MNCARLADPPAFPAALSDQLDLARTSPKEPEKPLFR
jgi:hypothetical protein